MRWIRVMALLILVGLISCSNLFAQYEGGSNDVILQGFHWLSANGSWWNTISANASTIQSAGFTMVWFPPVSLAASTQGYLPTQWYNLSSGYGNQSSLQNAVGALKSRGVKPIADIVINHRCGSTNWADFTNPSFANNNYAICYNDEYFASGNPGQYITERGAADTGEGYAPGRDLDHTNSSVQTEIKNWLNWLKNTIGFQGWRYDFVKGFGGTYVGAYNSATSPAFSVGEFWPTNIFYSSNPGDWRGQINNWISATGNRSTAFDFVTKPLLQEAFNNNNYGLLNSGGKPAGLIGVNPTYSVTFLDNHDTGPSPGGGQNHWPFPSGNVAAGYAYILTHPGTPCVYWPHYFDWGSGLQNEIKNMIALRKAQGINRNSSVSIQAADSSRYAAIIDGKVAVKIGPGSWSPSGTWSLALSGTNYAIWTGGSNGGGGTATTTIRAVYDVGMGNSMAVRGMSPLSWTTGAPMTWTTGNVWTYTTTSIPAGATFEYKVLINDTTWSDGANYVGTGGQTMTIYPTFTGNFYDTMDDLTNWTVSGYTGAGKWHVNNYQFRTYGCTSESIAILKPSLKKLGTVTLAFKRQVTGLDSGEYLAVDVYNGSAWKQVASYTGTLAAANVSINVSPYASSNFKVRFRAKMSATNEYAYVDNVSIKSSIP